MNLFLSKHVTAKAEQRFALWRIEHPCSKGLFTIFMSLKKAIDSQLALFSFHKKAWFSDFFFLKVAIKRNMSISLSLFLFFFFFLSSLPLFFSPPLFAAPQIVLPGADRPPPLNTPLEVPPTSAKSIPRLREF